MLYQLYIWYEGGDYTAFYTDIKKLLFDIYHKFICNLIGISQLNCEIDYIQGNKLLKVKNFILEVL